MFNQNCGTTLVSQLLDSIDGHLKNVHSPMEQKQQQQQQQQHQQSPEYEMSVDNPDDDELWLSGHRSIFSSYGSHCRKAPPQLRDSQYEGFHWDLYEDRNYHHLAFEQDQQDIPPTCQATSLSEWSMRLSSGVVGGEGDTEDDADVEGDDTTSSSDPPRTSWHAIKSKSIHRSCSSSLANTSDGGGGGGGGHRSRSPLTLYRLFQRTRSQQHPCRLYQNFSDKSMCDSLTSSSSCSNLNKSMKQEQKIPMPRFKLKSPTTFSQLKLNKSSSHNDLLSSVEQSSTKSKEQFKASNQTPIPRRSVDQCLQTSIHIDNTPSSQLQTIRRYIPRSTSRPINTDNQCLPIDNISVTRSKSADRLLNNDINTSNSNNPSQPSIFPSSTSHRSLPTISSLPDLSFLTYYAKENPAPPPLTPTTQTKRSCSGMKTTLSEPSSLTKKATRTVFYCSIKMPSSSSSSSVPIRPTTLHPPISTMQRPRTLKEIKRIKSIKTSPTMIGNSPLRALPLSPTVSSNVGNHIKEEETATFSSTCSSTSTSANSTSSSGYFSNSSTNHPRHIQTPTSLHPLKSCLKRAKTEDLTTTPLTTTAPTTANVLAVGAAGDIFTLAARTLAARLGNHEIETSRHRRYSAPTISSHQQNFSIQFRTRQKGCTLSEHDLRAKKSVSFCDDIARKLITPSVSPKHRPTPPPIASFRYDRGYCDLVPRESLTDSPPSEFNLSEEEHEDNNEPQLMNFTEHAPSELTKPLPVKYGSDKYLVDAFANTILRILEIKCGDPQSYYLNNITNRELDRTLRQDLCPLLREVLEDGLRQYGGSLFSKKVNLWRLIDLTTPTTGRFNEAKVKAQLGLSSTVDWSEKFNAFIYHLLNLHELAAWLTHFVSHRAMFTTYYESWAFVLVHVDNDLFERITNQLEKLSPLPFRLKYIHSSNIIPPARTINVTANQRSSSLLPKRFNVRAWLRDRKTQVKISPKEQQAPPLPPPPPSTSSSTSISKSPSSSAIPSTKSVSSVSTKSSSATPSGPPPNVSLRRKLGSIPVPKRHQTVH